MTGESMLFCARSVSKLKDCLSDAPGFLFPFFLSRLHSNRFCTRTDPYLYIYILER